MKRSFISILIIILFTTTINAQKKYTQEEVDKFIINPTKRERINEYLDMLKSDNNLMGWPYYYSKLSVLHLGENTLDSCYYYSNKAIESYETSTIKRKEDEEQLARAYYNGGRALRVHYKNYNKSLDYLMNALRVIKKYPKFSKYLKGYILKDISSNHLEMGDNNLALKYLLKTSRDTNYLKNPYNYGPLYNSIGSMYFDFKKIDSAKYFYKKALLDTIIGIKVTSHNYLGNLFYTIKNKDSAFYHYKKSKSIVDVHSEKVSSYSRFTSHVNYSYILLDEGKYDASILLLNKALDSLNAVGKLNKLDRDLKVRNMDYLIKAYEKSGKFEEALAVSKEKSDFLEIFHKEELDEKLRDLNVAYEVKEKDESIEQLETVTEEQQVIIKQRNVITIALGVLLLSILIIGLLFLRQRKLKNKYETANLEQRLLRSQLNPHFVFNALNTVNSLASKNSKNTTPYIAKLSSLIRLILKNSREEFVSLEDELKSIEDYLELQSNFSQKFNYKINIEHTIDQEETYIPPMFIQPFIENSIEHGLRGITDGLVEVNMTINDKSKLIVCKIIDNGIGISKASKFVNTNENKYESFSGKIIQERLKIYSQSLNKKAKYITKELAGGKGTEVNVLLPYVIES
ncbi:tetratricopeptide repeat-containing sensor histidine kinase [Aquimarina sp. 2201CG14-23]|uniref:tetratricopeptide repeat-containing sensor histidine kinase n=1 Tax=Aquimarina mycalae TaxID=3040073 RepID=UPI00247803B4|nr:histidine kinase [Aquimarina sp. 2201CG14-23]MDH7446926.1 histidine kinase [Aquimarina sp. 2201CG14-23]